MNTIHLTIDTPYITLQQAFKLSGVLSTGGSIKFFLQTKMIKVNGVPEIRRGRKLYAGDEVQWDDEQLVIVCM